MRVPTTEAARNEPKIVPSVSECITRAAIIMTTNCTRKKPATPHVAKRQNRALSPTWHEFRRAGRIRLL